jgi:two-component system, OmpR family, alkaline phosphatase synthesis response regulator PhoP
MMSERPDALTLMIVDDDELIRKVITIYFSGRGYRVVAVASGLECLAQMRLSEPDALLLDVTMPSIDGWEVCRRIREFSTVPIIMLTARAQESDREMGVIVGASAYVTKPVSLKELEARIRTLVQPPASANEADGFGV